MNNLTLHQVARSPQLNRLQYEKGSRNEIWNHLRIRERCLTERGEWIKGRSRTGHMLSGPEMMTHRQSPYHKELERLLIRGWRLGTTVPKVSSTLIPGISPILGMSKRPLNRTESGVEVYLPSGSQSSWLGIEKGFDERRGRPASVYAEEENGRDGVGGGQSTIYRARNTWSVTWWGYPTHSPSGMSSFPRIRGQFEARLRQARREVMGSTWLKILLDAIFTGMLRPPNQTEIVTSESTLFRRWRGLFLQYSPYFCLMYFVFG